MKKQKPPPKHEVTKGQLSRWQRERRLRRITLSFALVVIVSIIGIPGYGYWSTEVRPSRGVVARVNDQVFTVAYYVKMLGYYGARKASTPDELNRIADQTVTMIQNNELIRQLASNLAISASDEEIDEELKTWVAGSTEQNISEAEFQRLYQEQLKKLKLSDKEYRGLVTTEVLRWKLRDHIATTVPTTALQVHVRAMLLESNEKAEEMIARLKAGDDFATLAQEHSQHYSKDEGGDLGWLPQEIMSPQFDEIAFSLEVGEFSQPLWDEMETSRGGYWLLRVLEKDEEYAHVQAMLLESEGQAEEIRARLKAGDDFAILAQEHSQHYSKDKGGDLGWLKKGTMNPAFEEAAFDLEVDTLSQPIRDDKATKKGGYWVLKSLEKEQDRTLAEDKREMLIGKAFNEWFFQQREENLVESYLDDEKKAWAIGRVFQ